MSSFLSALVDLYVDCMQIEIITELSNPTDQSISTIVRTLSHLRLERKGMKIFHDKHNNSFINYRPIVNYLCCNSMLQDESSNPQHIHGIYSIFFSFLSLFSLSFNRKIMNVIFTFSSCFLLCFCVYFFCVSLI